MHYKLHITPLQHKSFSNATLTPSFRCCVFGLCASGEIECDMKYLEFLYVYVTVFSDNNAFEVKIYMLKFEGINHF